MNNSEVHVSGYRYGASHTTRGTDILPSIPWDHLSDHQGSIFAYSRSPIWKLCVLAAPWDKQRSVSRCTAVDSEYVACGYDTILWRFHGKLRHCKNNKLHHLSSAANEIRRLAHVYTRITRSGANDAGISFPWKAALLWETGEHSRPRDSRRRKPCRNARWECEVVSL